MARSVPGRTVAAERIRGIRHVPAGWPGSRCSPAAATAAEIRAWAARIGVEVNLRGRIPAAVREAFEAEQPG